MQCSKHRLLAAFLILQSCLPVSSFGALPVSDENLQAIGETINSIVPRGRFRFFPLCDGTNGPSVLLCEIDRGSSGGQFCFVAANDAPRILESGDGSPLDVFYCIPDEWHRLVDSAGMTNFAVVAMKRREEGTADDIGYHKEAFVSVFQFENGNVAETVSYPNAAGLIAAPSFALLERPLRFFARRLETGIWSASVESNAPLSCVPAILPTRPSTNQIDALQSFLRDRFEGIVPGASKVVFEADSRREPFFALVSDSADATEDGWHWSAFLWNGTEWTEAPTNGFACASGRCPALFRARPDEFYRLTLSGKAPRLVVLKNRNGCLRETFWEEALGPKAALLDWTKGMPHKDDMIELGFPNVPRSVFQSLIFCKEFQRLERIVPETLMP